jgi:EAL domain-containing protein (putative c-di-GMP-specific phosphodiesterase class I)
MVSVEALVRWLHPTLGRSAPIAGDFRMVVPLGEWLLQETWRTLAEWRRPDPARAPQTVSVNLARAETYQLRDPGVRLAMDDFGTGTSSLGCRRDYPFDTIKVDRSFVSELAAAYPGSYP